MVPLKSCDNRLICCWFNYSTKYVKFFCYLKVFWYLHSIVFLFSIQTTTRINFRITFSRIKLVLKRISYFNLCSKSVTFDSEPSTIEKLRVKLFCHFNESSFDIQSLSKNIIITISQIYNGFFWGSHFANNALVVFLFNSH